MSTVSVFHHGSQWICDPPRAGAAEKGHSEVLAESFAQARPRPELTDQVASLWLERGGGAWRRSRVLPDGFVDLIWGERLWVRGPDTRDHRVRYPSDATFVGIRFHPGAAAPLLGVPASELVDGRVYLTDLWGRAAVTLEEVLAGTQSVAGVMRVLQDAICERAAASGRPDAIVTAVVAATARRSSPTDIRGLARRLNVSERQLRRRCCAALGYGPKTLDRILRLQRALALARRQPSLTIGMLAARAGYADHAHLVRECRRLSGETPRALLGR